jgi:chromosome segregation ATPase
MVQVTSPTSLAIDSPQGRKLFVFDRVFGEDVNQEGIWEYLQESVGAFVQGYNVSMLAYGQSGAGKSYTMGTSGPAEQGDLDVMGVIPRAAAALFEKLEGPKPSFSNRNSMSGLRAPKGYSAMNGNGPKPEKNWTLKASYVEIYNEQLRDLLIPEHVPMQERGQVLIREDKGNILVTGLHQVEINSTEDLLNALNFGSTIRQTDATAINAKSSRSHAVFSLNLIQRKHQRPPTSAAEKRRSVPIEAMTGSDNWVTIDSKLHFVDLAGSERLKNTGAQGDRAKEGISINAGLASLGKVISQLSSRHAGSHVSYRDSKLTRLLQDSLGGNAITYMIACVTPAEFHLSETLNTVQYAQRARAIQSKPRIQQISDDSDKQALIDRLKAEVAFLRAQIQSSERGDPRGRTNASMERPERSNEKEIELQNQLLDTQESYTTLSQRHAKLISEMTKARESEMAENMSHEHSMGDSATERLKRSNKFAEAVEQVVLEYEKTIQSLEQSLSSTRGSLSATETQLLEKETKCAYIETLNHQLQARLQKLMDREASTENYLHDLEAKIDGHSSGGEKNLAIINELRKEIARVRENEASCEDYISTLEERLAEADQDAELMQREIERLEHVVERQRSLGKLDNLLYELDHIQQNGRSSQAEDITVNGVHSRNDSYASRPSVKDVIHENGEGEHLAEHEDRMAVRPLSLPRTASEGPVDNGEPIEELQVKPTTPTQPANGEYLPQSPAQSRFVEDKFQDVQQELVDLRVEHEATLNEFDLLSAKYDEALRTLAELQDAVDEARSPNGIRDSSSMTSPGSTRPTSFLADARVSELKNGDGQHSSSRSLSSELSSAGDSTITSTTEASDADAANHNKKSVSNVVRGLAQDDQTLAVEVENLKRLAAEKEAAERALAEKYAKLEEEHHDTLDRVEELKAEVQKAKMSEAHAGSPKSSSPIIRRKSSQNVMIIDRAHRSFASLRNIAAENFDDQPDVMQNFELNLNTAMHELHARSERVQELEADLAAVKKEMETKSHIISGLTRERSSIKAASPMDMAVVAQLREQLIHRERQILEDGTEMEILREKLEEREKELTAEIWSLRLELDKHVDYQALADKSLEERNEMNVSQDSKIAGLKGELAEWQNRHQAALASMQASQEQLMATIKELESELAAAKSVAAAAAPVPKEGELSRAIDLANHDGVVRNHAEVVESLTKQIGEHKATIATNQARVAELEADHTKTQSLLSEATQARDQTLQHNKDLLEQLEKKVAEHEDTMTAHRSHVDRLLLEHAEQTRMIRSALLNEHTQKFAVVEKEYKELLAEKERDIEKRDYHIEELTSKLSNIAQEDENRREENAAYVRSVYHMEETTRKQLQEAFEQSLEQSDAELAKVRATLNKIAAQVGSAFGVEVSVDKLQEKIDKLITEQKAYTTEHEKTKAMGQALKELAAVQAAVMSEMDIIKPALRGLIGTVSKDELMLKASTPEQLVVLEREITALIAQNNKKSHLLEEMEEQLATNYDQQQAATNRLSTLQSERHVELEEARSHLAKLQTDMDHLTAERNALLVCIDAIYRRPHKLTGSQAQIEGMGPLSNGRTSSVSNGALMMLKKSNSNASLPSPPPNAPLPAIPGSGTTSFRQSKDLVSIPLQEHKERMSVLQKALDSEREMTVALEQAMEDLERSQNKAKADYQAWKRRAEELEAENKELKERPSVQEAQRWSLHQVEEERKKRRDAEVAKQQLEERMNQLNKKNKKKKGSLNCF